MIQDNFKRKIADPNTLLDRLKEAYDIRFDAQLARVLEVNASTVATWRKNDIMKFDKIIEFSNDLNLNWLFYGEEPVWRNQIQPSAAEPELPYYADLLSFDPTQKLKGGDQKSVYLPIPVSFIAEEIAADIDELFLTRAVGNGMEPTIRNRELLLVHKQVERPYAGRIYLIRMEESVLCKRIHELPGQHLRLISDNTAYDEIVVEEKGGEIEILGRVAWHGRTL